MAVDPARLRIEVYPTEVLRTKADPVEPGDGVRAVAERMVELMRGADGIGLAAPQVGLTWRLFVAHVPPADPDEPLGDPAVWSSGPEVFINPEVVEHSNDLEPYDEGCLSLPGILGEVRRPSVVTVRALDLEGNVFERRAGGLLGRCYQHEIDHLDGVLILDKMSQTSRTKNRSRIKSLEKSAR